jgi:hypothetical protein
MIEDQMFNSVIKSIPEVIENPKFELKIQNSENKIIARVASWYANSEQMFEELYIEIESKWHLVTNALPAKKLETLGEWWARNIVLEYLEKQKKANG